MLVAVDIFCVGVVVQLVEWGCCVDVLVVIGVEKVDLVSVVFDGMECVVFEGIDIFMIDIVGCL